MAEFRILTGDALAMARHCRQAQTIVTSPPYFSFRAYGDDEREIGTVKDGVKAYVQRLVEVFGALPLAADGCLWVNLGDAYAGGGGLVKWGAKYHKNINLWMSRLIRIFAAGRSSPPRKDSKLR